MRELVLAMSVVCILIRSGTGLYTVLGCAVRWRRPACPGTKSASPGDEVDCRGSWPVRGNGVSDIRGEDPSGRDPGGTETPNCVDCSRSVEHSECTVLHLLDGRWVTERGSHSARLGMHAARKNAEAA